MCPRRLRHCCCLRRGSWKVTAPTPPLHVPAVVGTATASPVLVVPIATFELSAMVAPPAPPADACEGSLDVEGFITKEPFFLGTIDDEDGDETR